MVDSVCGELINRLAGGEQHPSEFRRDPSLPLSPRHLTRDVTKLRWIYRGKEPVNPDSFGVKYSLIVSGEGDKNTIFDFF